MIHLYSKGETINDGTKITEDVTWFYKCQKCENEFRFRFTPPLFCVKCGIRILPVGELITTSPKGRIKYHVETFIGREK